MKISYRLLMLSKFQILFVNYYSFSFLINRFHHTIYKPFKENFTAIGLSKFLISILPKIETSKISKGNGTTDG